MKIAFVGPSLPDALSIAGGVELRPPARHGDLHRAVVEGATAICLIDGYFENVAPVRHKEILFALSRGVAVIGASSMGALRAAECAAFGMQGVGRIFESYHRGETHDDADVALLHAPAELGYAPLTLPMVNIRASLDEMVRLGICSPEEGAITIERAARLFYQDRTWASLRRHLSEILLVSLRSYYIDQKRLDAIQAIKAVECIARPEVNWELNMTEQFRTSFN